MPWIKETLDQRNCPVPMIWFRPVGAQWRCPDCQKLWEVMINPDQFVGGKRIIPVGNYKVSFRCGSNKRV